MLKHQSLDEVGGRFWHVRTQPQWQNQSMLGSMERLARRIVAKYLQRTSERDVVYMLYRVMLLSLIRMKCAKDPGASTSPAVILELSGAGTKDSVAT